MAIDDRYGETEAQRMLRTSRANPAFPIGITGCVLVVLYGAYRYKHRGTMSTSLFLIRLRVAAQGTVIGSLCLGLAYSLGEKVYAKLQKNDQDR